jgi:molybdenum cofactor synthesis domain-containing protein
MSSTDESKNFIPLNIAVLTISDTRTLADDKSGTTLAERLIAAGHHLAAREIIVDDVDAIRIIVKRWLADPTVDVIITTGGTGFTGRDVTPEAVEPLFEKKMDGFSIAFHMLSHAKIGASTIQSRARRLPRRLGRYSAGPARLPHPALQFCRDHAAARRTSAAAEGAGRDGLIRNDESETKARAPRSRQQDFVRSYGAARWPPARIRRPDRFCARRPECSGSTA